MQTLQETIRKIAKKGWRVHFEGFRSDVLYFTITTPVSSRVYSHISGAVSQQEMDYGKIDILEYRLEKAFRDLERLEENPYGRNPEGEAAETEEIHGGLSGAL